MIAIKFDRAVELIPAKLKIHKKKRRENKRKKEKKKEKNRKEGPSEEKMLIWRDEFWVSRALLSVSIINDQANYNYNNLLNRIHKKNVTKNNKKKI